MIAAGSPGHWVVGRPPGSSWPAPSRSDPGHAMAGAARDVHRPRRAARVGLQSERIAGGPGRGGPRSGSGAPPSAGERPDSSAAIRDGRPVRRSSRSANPCRGCRGRADEPKRLRLPERRPVIGPGQPRERGATPSTSSASVRPARLVVVSRRRRTRRRARPRPRVVARRRLPVPRHSERSAPPVRDAGFADGGKRSRARGAGARTPRSPARTPAGGAAPVVAGAAAAERDAVVAVRWP